MAIEVRCPDCGLSSHPPDDSRGKWALCRCGAEFPIPEVDPIHAGPWREGDLLVASPDSALPDHCIKCDAPAEGRRIVVGLRRTVSVKKPFELALYLIMSILQGKEDRTEIQAGICRRHQVRHRLSRLPGLVVVLAGLGLIVAGVLLGNKYTPVLVAGAAIWITAPITLDLPRRLLSASRVESGLVWIKGAGPAYLSRFPERDAGEGDRDPGSSSLGSP